jgi:hypothetical protein
MVVRSSKSMAHPGNITASPRVRCRLLVVCGIAAAWSIVVAVSGGFVLEWGSVRLLASREPRNPAALALLIWNAWWLLAGSPERSRLRRRVWTAFSGTSVFRAARSIPPQFAPALGATAAVAIVVLGITRGAPYAGGSDAYGYVSQAHLWATGTMRVEQPFVRDIPWDFVAEAVTPLAFRPTENGTVIVPVYSPGLPMLMGLFERVGGPDAVFLVVPLLAGMTVWATYLMGARLAGPTVGALAAVLLASSPVFLFQTMLPMSDVPVTAWWALALALLLRDSRRAALMAGLACGAAILTRPNLMPLAGILGIPLIWRAVRTHDFRGPAGQRALLFAAGIVPGCAIVMAVNRALWGSVLASGYGPLDALYSWRNLLPNLARYPRWLIDTQTPIVLLAAVSPWLIARSATAFERTTRPRSVSILWLWFIAAVFLSYLFHLPNDGWFWLRYVLPALPPMMVLAGVVLTEMVAGAERGLRAVVLAVALGLVAAHGLTFSYRAGNFGVREGERKWQAVGEYVAARLPERAAVIAKLHTGSIRYYSGRFTVRYDWIPPMALDMVVADLSRLGYRPFIVLEQSEEEEFRTRFQESRTLDALEHGPAAVLDAATKVRIYDPLEPPAETGRVTDIIR